MKLQKPWKEIGLDSSSSPDASAASASASVYSIFHIFIFM